MTNMPDRTGRKTGESSRTSEYAHTIERAGLAVLGALCGLFVSALIAKADIQAINTVGALFATMLYGTIGFYLGIDFPLPTARIVGIASIRNGIRSTAIFLKLIGAIGTLLAAMAAMISVCLIICDSVPYTFCLVVIGGAWFIGVAMQLAAGTMARMPRTAGAASALSALNNSEPPS